MGCLIATQNPGDIDYKAIAQFSTTNLGSLTQKQDLKKVQPRLEASIQTDADRVISKLPGLSPGHFLLISPDYDNIVQEVTTRRLLTEHLTLSEEQLDDYINPEIRAELQALISQQTEEESAAEAETVIQADIVPEPDEVTPAPIKEDVESKPAVPKNTSADDILVTRHVIFERDLEKFVKPYLEGSLIKSELLSDSSFNYLPIILVKLVFLEQKGFFKKKEIEIAENLYLHYKSHDLMFVQNKKFEFSSVVDIDPHKIKDLDDVCKLETQNKSDIHFDFRSIGGTKIDQREIKHLMERKFNVRVENAELVLFPVWYCTLKNKKSGKSRQITLDAIFGNLITP